MPEALPESVARLLSGRNGEEPFLQPHHAEAAGRLATTFERARLRQRVTMSYDPTRVGRQGGGGSGQSHLAGSAADARQRLAETAASMPAECWSVLFDVCGFDLGMQEVEARHGWPRRGGKLVLRIALAQLAAYYGLAAEAQGRESGRIRNWLPNRVAMFAGEAAS